MKPPDLSDKVVKVKAYMTDEVFGYDHWRAAQFCPPDDSRPKPALLLIFSTVEERDEALKKHEGA